MKSAELDVWGQLVEVYSIAGVTRGAGMNARSECRQPSVETSVLGWASVTLVSGNGEFLPMEHQGLLQVPEGLVCKQVVLVVL